MSTPTPCGLGRYLQWKKTLFVRPDEPDDETKAEYFRVRASLAEKLAQVTRVSAGSDGEIMRDVIRTFQKQKFFQRYQPGQRMLLHILFCLVASRPDVGYCQGMNYVVAALLLGRIPESYTDITEIDAVVDGDGADNGDGPEGSGDNDASSEPAAAIVKAPIEYSMPVEMMDEAEVDVYLVMMEMLRPDSKLDMAGMWKERIPKLKLRIYQLDRLLRWTYPQLHAHFAAIELSPEVITAQWFLTLFTYTFPVVPTVLQLWDYIFLTGWEGLFKVALSMLGALQPRLLALGDFESIVMLMREWKREGKMIIQEPMEALIARADKFVINREVLDRLQETFASEILSIALIRSQMLINDREQQAAVLAAAAQGASSPGSQGSSSPVPRPALGSSLSIHFASLTSSLGSSASSSSSKKGAAEDSGAQGSAQTSVDSSSEDNSSVNTGLASLSLAERRKVIQAQQAKEALFEEQMLAASSNSAEAPVFWLLRYGSKLPEKVLQELRKIKLDLLAMDHQVDVDKEQIQAKIIKACDMNRETQDELESAEHAMHEAAATVEQGRASLQSALILARQVALEVVELMEGPAAGDLDGSNGSTAPVSEHSITSFGSYSNGATASSFYSTSSSSGTQKQTASANSSRNNSSDMRHSGDGSSSSANSSSGSGLRFPSMLTGSWSNLRGSPSGTSSSTSIGSGKKTAHSSASAQPDADDTAGVDGTAVPSDGSPSQSARHRNHAVDGIASSSVQDSEFDERTAPGGGNIVGSGSNKAGYRSSPVSSPKKPFGSSSTSTTVQASSPSSGGLLSSLASTRLHWNFPVVRAIHGVAAPTHGEITPSGLTAAITSNSSSRSAAKTANRQMKQLEKRGQWVQQQIIDIDRALEESKRNMEFARRRLEQAKVSNEETVQWKNSLCDQLHLLVRDSNRGRSQKLMYVAENYNI